VQTQEWQATFRANLHNGAYTDTISSITSSSACLAFQYFQERWSFRRHYHFDRPSSLMDQIQSKRFVYSFFERFGTFYNGRLNEFRTRTSYRPRQRSH